jgi:putative peptide zinc metalloprotease protein
MTVRTEERGSVDTGAAPSLAEGIDLIGEYEDSGYKEPHYIARRADGQTIQLTELLHLVAEQCDGQRTYDDIAPLVAEQYGKGVSADNVQYLVEEKLRPLGVLAGADGSSPPVAKGNPLLALRFKFTLLPEGKARFITTFFKPLFLPPAILAVIAGFVAMGVWLWGVHGIGQGMRDALYQPLTILLIFGMVVLAAGFHEFGHAAACTYGGAKPGKIGGGLYLVWPAFYTDVTDAYRLSRGGRLRTDLGGVYFNLIFSLLTLGAYALTGFEPLLLLIPIQHIEIVHQLLPFLRMDGYYILADLTGVPDLFTRIRPILQSLVPWRRSDEKVRELKRWVRLVVTLWVVAIVPLLLYLFAMTVITAPRVLATAWDSLAVQYGKTSDAFADGQALRAVAGIVQLLALGLPMVGLVYSIVRITKTAVAGGWHWSEGSVVRRALVVVATAGAATLALGTWWPNGEYRPIQKGERFVVQDSFRSISAISTGRPGLTADRAEELDGAPTVRDATATQADDTLVDPADAQSQSSTTTTTEADEVTTTVADRTTATTARPTATTARATATTAAPTTTTTTSAPTTTTTSTSDTTDTTAP